MGTDPGSSGRVYSTFNSLAISLAPVAEVLLCYCVDFPLVPGDFSFFLGFFLDLIIMQ